jgi:hypothetical protein
MENMEFLKHMLAEMNCKMAAEEEGRTKKSRPRKSKRNDGRNDERQHKGNERRDQIWQSGNEVNS